MRENIRGHAQPQSASLQLALPPSREILVLSGCLWRIIAELFSVVIPNVFPWLLAAFNLQILGSHSSCRPTCHRFKSAQWQNVCVSSQWPAHSVADDEEKNYLCGWLSGCQSLGYLYVFLNRGIRLLVKLLLFSPLTSTSARPRVWLSPGWFVEYLQLAARRNSSK